ncbi:hypothetical protein FGSG_13533 [Fusarium graminearum PH-1]|uniref:Chromosome 4, complete genome n=1 Tax=Gibberella zeae (strain ATCC MYA-4620 / CBS 123657 / FGSC 9075 / NRRL 31084 / PH-1) TaxID=229533 RepID=I1S9K2_GIBZE|nr:hypothetical protein FGSG_13533 [Fusarium graminearum PH-1]ESU15782.1 hypothetical protein FGSG_13533 [Fusarium graminearum PH-1]CEF83352.1 unnamed protein product [Fusarium graminearum]|eukprot:XP_011328534.1 hypothetical protein FGSG_13533 [Fusarium graminearum PH-1]
MFKEDTLGSPVSRLSKIPATKPMISIRSPTYPPPQSLSLPHNHDKLQISIWIPILDPLASLTSVTVNGCLALPKKNPNDTHHSNQQNASFVDIVNCLLDFQLCRF